MELPKKQLTAIEQREKDMLMTIHHNLTYTSPQIRYNLNNFYRDDLTSWVLKRFWQLRDKEDGTSVSTTLP